MGSTGYLTCGICWMCGKCYPRKATCPQCGGTIDLDEECCAQCGRAICDVDRQRARESFKAAKKLEAEQTFADRASRPAAPSAAPLPPTKERG